MPYTARTTGTVSVDVQKDGGAADGTEPWTVTAAAPFSGSDFTEAGTGDATLTGPIYQGREYQIVFDPVSGFLTPTAANITASGTPQTFTGNYVTAEVSSVTVQLPSITSEGVDSQDITWTLHGPTSPNMPTGTYDGVGTETVTETVPGDYWVQWSWQEYFDMPTAGDYYTNHEDNPGGTQNGPWSSPVQTRTGTTPEIFVGDYTARALPDKADSAIGMNLLTPTPWGTMLQSVSTSGRGAWDGLATLDEWGWPLTDAGAGFGLVAPIGFDGSQTFHMFWEGNGTVRFEDLTNGGTIWGPTALVDANGQTGITFQYPIDQTPGSYNTVKLHITSTGTGGNHFRNVEVVHEEYLGKTTGTPDPAKKDFRGFGAGNTHLNQPFAEVTKYAKSLRFMSYSHFFNSDTQWVGTEGQGAANWSTGIVAPFDTNAAHGRQWDSGYGSGEVPQTGETLKAIIQQTINVCNAGNCDLYLNFHPYAGENFAIARKYIEAIEAPYVENPTSANGAGGLKPELKVYTEWGNEVWLFAGAQWYGQFFGCWYAGMPTQWNGDPWPANMLPNPYAGSPHPGFETIAADPQHRSYFKYTAFANWRIDNLYETILDELGKLRDPEDGAGWNGTTYGRASDRLVRNIAWRHHGPLDQIYGDYAGGTTSFHVAGTPKLYEEVETHCIAPYWEQEVWQGPPAYSRDPPPADWEQGAADFWTAPFAVTWGIEDSHPFRTPDGGYNFGDAYQLRARCAEADSYPGGPRIIAYEGGSGWQPPSTTPDVEAYNGFLNRHHRCYESTMTILNVCKQGTPGGSGMHEFNYYNSPLNWALSGPPGFWGISNGYYEPKSQAWKAMIDFIHANPKWW